MVCFAAGFAVVSIEAVSGTAFAVEELDSFVVIVDVFDVVDTMRVTSRDFTGAGDALFCFSPFSG